MEVACVVYYAFLGVLRYLNKAFVFFCAKYFNKKNKTVLITSISILLIRANQSPFMIMTLQKTLMTRSKLLNNFLKNKTQSNESANGE